MYLAPARARPYAVGTRQSRGCVARGESYLGARLRPPIVSDSLISC
jgi:hypothetical protein